MSGWKYWTFFVCLPNQCPSHHVSQNLTPSVCHPLASPTHLWGRFMSMCLHRPHPRCLLVQAEHWNMYSSRLVLPPWSASLFPSFFSFFWPSSPGLTDVECLGTSTRLYCLHCFLCMTLYAVSMLKKKKETKKKHSAKPIYIFWTKKKK